MHSMWPSSNQPRMKCGCHGWDLILRHLDQQQNATATRPPWWVWRQGFIMVCETVHTSSRHSKYYLQRTEQWYCLEHTSWNTPVTNTILISSTSHAFYKFLINIMLVAKSVVASAWQIGKICQEAREIGSLAEWKWQSTVSYTCQ